MRERAERELDLQMALGPALVATKSHSHPDIGRAYTRAWELCRQLGDHSRGFAALRGLMLYHTNRAETDGDSALDRALRPRIRRFDLGGDTLPVPARRA